MQLNISGHHLDVTSAIKNHVSEKFERLHRHSDQITSTNIILSVDKLIQKAEAKVHVSGGEFFANSENEDLYAAIDTLVDKLDRQLIKHKEKQRGR